MKTIITRKDIETFTQIYAEWWNDQDNIQSFQEFVNDGILSSVPKEGETDTASLTTYIEDWASVLKVIKSIKG